MEYKELVMDIRAFQSHFCGFVLELILSLA